MKGQLLLNCEPQEEFVAWETIVRLLCMQIKQEVGQTLVSCYCLWIDKLVLVFLSPFSSWFLLLSPLLWMARISLFRPNHSVIREWILSSEGMKCSLNISFFFPSFFSAVFSHYKRRKEICSSRKEPFLHPFPASSWCLVIDELVYSRWVTQLDDSCLTLTSLVTWTYICTERNTRNELFPSQTHLKIPWFRLLILNDIIFSRELSRELSREIEILFPERKPQMISKNNNCSWLTHSLWFSSSYSLFLMVVYNKMNKHYNSRLLHQQMQQQKLLHGSSEKKDHHHMNHHHHRSSIGGVTPGSTTSSLHRFSVDALAGNCSSLVGGKKRSANNLTSYEDDDDNSINSWDEQLGECSDDDDIDVDDVDPLSPTTSDSSRGGSSPVGVKATASSTVRSRSRK